MKFKEKKMYQQCLCLLILKGKKGLAWTYLKSLTWGFFLLKWHRGIAYESWEDGLRRENWWKTIYCRNWAHIFRECLTTGLRQDYRWIYLKRVRVRIQKSHRNVISSLHSHGRQAVCSRKTRMQSSASLQPSPWFFESVLGYTFHETQETEDQ